MGFEIPVDVDYFDHPKTLKLCRILGRPEADCYPLRVWKWATLYAKRGFIEGGVAEIEGAAKWRGAPGRLHAALMEAGFVEPDGKTLHNWMKRIGRAIFIYDEKKRKQREKYEKNSGILPEEFRTSSPYPGGEEREDRDNREERRGPTPASPPAASPSEDAEVAETVSKYGAWSHPTPEKKAEGVRELRALGLSHDYIRNGAQVNKPADAGFWDIIRALKAVGGKRQTRKAHVPGEMARENVSAYERTPGPTHEDREAQRKHQEEAAAKCRELLLAMDPDERDGWYRDARAAAEKAKIFPAALSSFIESQLLSRIAKEHGIEGL